MTSSPCPCCHTGRKGAGKYLCRYCWFKLTPAARHALYIRDRLARARLQDLYRKINAGVPLGDIVIEGTE